VKDWNLKQIDWPYTPLELYVKFYPKEKNFFLFSSLQSGHNVRFSYLSCDPVLTISAKQDRITLEENGKTTSFEGNPFDLIDRRLRECQIDYRFDKKMFGQNFFSGGAVGYWGYDLKDQLEKLPSTAQDDPSSPDAVWMFYDGVVIIDHVNRKYYLTGTDEKIGQLEKIIFADTAKPEKMVSFDYEITKTVSKKEYLKKIEAIHEYIACGDVYEINLAQRFDVKLKGANTWTHYHIFKNLFETSPSPFSALLKCGEFSVISSSPERFLRIRGKELESKPIKGTRPRRADFFEDEAMYMELLKSEKDRAENVMIVDLVRNDIGRVSETGSVKVPGLFDIEKYTTVFQMVSTVTGQLENGRTPMEAVKACFPPGSMTGAPKIRAMEIIEELEEFKRGIYSGALGYMGYDGNSDLSVIIRTLILEGDRGYFQTGGAIVWDSDPEQEYQECMDKAQGIIRALEILTSK
jgi:para-aminobenzoate synthetase component 1